MRRFANYCTEEQTKKAFELDAPLIKCDSRDKRMMYCDHLCYPRIADYPYVIPTTEEMVGWLEDQGLHISIIYNDCTYKPEVRDMHDGFINKDEHLSSHKNATLAAIDAALEYLSKNKK